MVWGMHEPNRFGEFWPDVDDVGRLEVLEEWYANMSDAEKAERGMKQRLRLTKVSAKFTQDLGPLSDPECPKEFKAVKIHKSLGALIQLNNRMLAVERKFKDLLEELESGTHQFWPLKITLPRDKVLPGEYFGLRIGQFLDSFDPNQTDPGCVQYQNSEYFRGILPNKKTITGIAVSKGKVGGAHLWRERKLAQPDIFLSNELHQRAIQRGLRLPNHYEMKEV